LGKLASPGPIAYSEVIHYLEPIRANDGTVRLISQAVSESSDWSNSREIIRA
jgi:hypothetical protein